MDYFLEKYKNNTKILNYIKNNTLGEKNIPFYLQEKTPIKFYNVPSV